MDDYEEEFGELALVIGDFHIPSRAADIPEGFKDMIVPNKVQNVFCTGNIGNRETTDWLKTLSGNTHLVKGDFDESKDLPEHKVIQIGSWKIALIHGHQIVPWGDDQALFGYLRELDADVLISGHTHQNHIQAVDKKYILNPGSATGAYSPLTYYTYMSVLIRVIHPSFMILEFTQNSLVVFTYTLQDDDVKIDKATLPLQK